MKLLISQDGLTMHNLDRFVSTYVTQNGDLYVEINYGSDYKRDIVGNYKTVEEVKEVIDLISNCIADPYLDTCSLADMQNYGSYNKRELLNK